MVAPVRIGIYYSFILVLASLLCFRLVGARTLVEYASKSRPHSVLFLPYYLKGLSSKAVSDERSHEIRIISFGDSNSFYPPDLAPLGNSGIDTHMSSLINKEINSGRQVEATEVWEWAFVGANMFDFYCMFYWAQKFKPDLIIIPINWRSFGPGWVINDSELSHEELSAFVPLREGLMRESPVRSRGIKPMKQAQYKVGILSDYLAGTRTWALENSKSFFDKIFQNADPEKKESGGGPSIMDQLELIAFVRIDGEISFKTKANWGKEQLRQMYPQEIISSNRAFRDLCALAHIASKSRTKVFFYLLPIDEEYLEKVGSFERPVIERSKQLMIRSILQEGIYCMDLAGLLEHKYFYDADGHFTAEGRQKIAEALKPKIIEFLGEKLANRK